MHLYVFQSHVTGHIKIGRSNDPATRLTSVQTGCPTAIRIVLIAYDQGYREKDLHRLCKRYKLRQASGEWFSEEALGLLPSDVWDKAEGWYINDPDWWKRQ